MNNYMCKCVYYEIEEICISLKCPKNERYCCTECATDNYMNQEFFIKKFLKDAKELIENRYNQIVYLSNQFKSLFQQQLIPVELKDEVLNLFLVSQKHQVKLNEKTKQAIQDIYIKITGISGFINLTKKQLKIILMIRCFKHNNNLLRQILSKLQNIDQIKSSNLFINLRLISIRSTNILYLKNKYELELKSGKNIFTDDNFIYWTNFNKHIIQGELSLQEINSQFKKSVEIIFKCLIKNMLIRKKQIIFLIYRACQSQYSIIGITNGRYQKKQFQIFLRDYLIINQSKFERINKSIIIIIAYNSGKFIIFNCRNKKNINIIQMKYKTINYQKIFNQLVMIQKKSLVFYDFNTKKFKNKIQLPLLEGQYQYVTKKQQFIICKNEVIVYRIDYKKQTISNILFQFDNAISFVYNTKHNYLIIFNKDNEITILDSNYFLIKRIKWEQVLHSYICDFIVSKDMKYIFLGRSLFDDWNKLRVYRWQIAL